MQQNRLLQTAARIAVLTIAAFVLAQAAAVLVRGRFDAALKNAPTVVQSRSETVAPLQPRPDAPDGTKTARVHRTDAYSGVKVEQISDTQWTLDRTSLLANTRNVNRFLMQARAVPYKIQGRIVGYQITRLSQGSLYEKIGLRNGDVLLQVNSRKLNDPAKLFSLYQEMRNKRHIALRLSRNGQDQIFTYDMR